MFSIIFLIVFLISVKTLFIKKKLSQRITKIIHQLSLFRPFITSSGHDSFRNGNAVPLNLQGKQFPLIVFHIYFEEKNYTPISYRKQLN